MEEVRKSYELDMIYGFEVNWIDWNMGSRKGLKL
jgi:hypothetical protein